MSYTHERRMEVERILVDAYIEEAMKRGWSLLGVDDESNDSGWSTVADRAAAVEAVFSYDECHVYFRGPGKRIKSPMSWMWFVLGNEGWTVLADYTVDLDPAVDALDAKVEAFEEEYYR
jgi:hypothetical protein